MKTTSLILAGIFGTTMASLGAVVYQSDFTDPNTTLADTGLVNSGAGGDWVFDATDDHADFDWTARNGRANLYTSSSFQSDDGFILDVSFLQTTAGSRFSFGLVDNSFAVPNGEDWLTQALPGGYGIGFNTSGGVSGGGDALAFNAGGTPKNNFDDVDTLSTAQGNISFGSLQTMSITVTEDSWSYSLNGAAPTTGSFTFDTSKNYRFNAYIQESSGVRTEAAAANGVQGSYYSNITLTAVVPEPSSTALLGLGGLALMLRRKRS